MSFRRLPRAHFPKLLGALLDQVHPLHQQITAPYPFLHYYWALTQSEFATDLLFDSPAALARIYPPFVRHAASRIRQVLTLDER